MRVDEILLEEKWTPMKFRAWKRKVGQEFYLYCKGVVKRRIEDELHVTPGITLKGTMQVLDDSNQSDYETQIVRDMITWEEVFQRINHKNSDMSLFLRCNLELKIKGRTTLAIENTVKGIKHLMTRTVNNDFSLYDLHADPKQLYKQGEDTKMIEVLFYARLPTEGIKKSYNDKVKLSQLIGVPRDA